MKSNHEGNALIANPGHIGRIARITLGAFQLFFVVTLAIYFWYYVSSEIPVGGYALAYLFGVLLAFAPLNFVVNIGFNVSWGRRPQIVFLLIALAATAIDLVAFGSLWAPPLAFVVFAMTIYVHTHLGISHVLSAILATPGCEMRAIPHLAARVLGRNVEAEACPVLWDSLDRWEDGRNHETTAAKI